MRNWSTQHKGCIVAAMEACHLDLFLRKNLPFNMEGGLNTGNSAQCGTPVTGVFAPELPIGLVKNLSGMYYSLRLLLLSPASFSFIFHRWYPTPNKPLAFLTPFQHLFTRGLKMTHHPLSISLQCYLCYKSHHIHGSVLGLTLSVPVAYHIVYAFYIYIYLAHIIQLYNIWYLVKRVLPLGLLLL